MIKKSLLISMVSALAISASGVVFAMEEDQKEQSHHTARTAPFFSDDEDGLPNETKAHVLSFLPLREICEAALVSKRFSELIKTPALQQVINRAKASVIFDQCGISAIIRSAITKSRVKSHTSVEAIQPDEAMEPIIDILHKAIEKHLEYGFTVEFIKNIIKLSANYLDQNPTMLASATWEVSQIYACQILGVQLGEESASSTIKKPQRNTLRGILVSLHEKNPFLHNIDSDRAPHPSLLPNYETHFETIFRFMDGMTEEQQTSTISLLSPHVSKPNFHKFYPYILSTGMSDHNVSYSTGEDKVRWLRLNLKMNCYFPSNKDK
jgi:hypothetical protein